jgi:hypothetical protein
MFIKLEPEFLKSFLLGAVKRIDIWSPWITEYGMSILQEVASARSDLEINVHCRLVDDDIIIGMLDVSGLHSLLRSGRNIHLFVHDDLHAKLFLVDRCKAIVGSYNLTQKAFKQNYELAFITDQCQEIFETTNHWIFREVFAGQVWAKCLFLEDFKKKFPDQQAFMNNEMDTSKLKNVLYGLSLRR